MNIKQLLDHKGHEVVQARPGENARVAMNRMIEKRVGSLLIVDAQEALLGIVTERDILRRVVAIDQSLDDLSLSEIMTHDVMIVTPQDSLQRLMALMTQNRVRHMPVFEGSKLIGLISIGDVVNALLEKTEQENCFLRDYISGHQGYATSASTD
jgi:CBS domain-containing protein